MMFTPEIRGTEQLRNATLAFSYVDLIAANTTSFDIPNTGRQTHLHLELKVFVLPLPAENVTRNANANGLLEADRIRPDWTRDQVLQRW